MHGKNKFSVMEDNKGACKMLPTHSQAHPVHCDTIILYDYIIVYCNSWFC